jgi:hypothetical protein
MPVDEATKRRIDQWIKDNKRNEFGDKPGTVYMGGSPLFNEMTGQTRDLYDYVLEKNPELRKNS